VHGTPAAITDVYSHLIVWVTGDNGHLYAHWWDGGAWHFDDHGTGGSPVHGTPAAITDVYSHLIVWVTGDNGHLYAHWWDGGAWHFDDHGTGGASFASNPAVITDVYSHLLVFVSGWDHHLYAHWWDGGDWHWDDHSPSGGGSGGAGGGGAPSAPFGPNRVLQSPCDDQATDQAEPARTVESLALRSHQGSGSASMIPLSLPEGEKAQALLLGWPLRKRRLQAPLGGLSVDELDLLADNLISRS
jgi:hypothetical protein